MEFNNSHWYTVMGSEEPAKDLGSLLRNEMLPEISALAESLRNTEQPPDYHPEGNAWEHTIQTLDWGAKIAERENLSCLDRQVLMLACLCHDLGKITTQVIRKGRITFYGHGQQGVMPTRDLLEKIGIAATHIQVIENMVAEHFSPIFFFKTENVGDEAILGFIERLKSAEVSLLVLLSEADQRARGDYRDPLVWDDETFLPSQYLLGRVKALYSDETTCTAII